jgi:hypothetical protein
VLPTQIVPTAAVAVTVGNAFTLTVTVAVFTQLLASVPVTVYVVVVVGDTVTLEPDRLPGFQLNTANPVPPDEEDVSITDEPTQIVELFDDAVTLSAGGWVILKVCVDVHPLASVTVQVHEPAVRPLTDVVPSPVGLPGVQL